MSDQWRADLRLELEKLIDRFLVGGMDRAEVLGAAREAIEVLRNADETHPIQRAIKPQSKSPPTIGQARPERRAAKFDDTWRPQHSKEDALD
jgi:hypothetical protein